MPVAGHLGRVVEGAGASPPAGRSTPGRRSAGALPASTRPRSTADDRSLFSLLVTSTDSRRWAYELTRDSSLSSTAISARASARRGPVQLGQRAPVARPRRRGSARATPRAGRGPSRRRRRGGRGPSGPRPRGGRRGRIRWMSSWPHGIGEEVVDGVGGQRRSPVSPGRRASPGRWKSDPPVATSPLARARRGQRGAALGRVLGAVHLDAAQAPGGEALHVGPQLAGRHAQRGRVRERRRAAGGGAPARWPRAAPGPRAAPRPGPRRPGSGRRRPGGRARGPPRPARRPRGACRSAPAARALTSSKDTGAPSSSRRATMRRARRSRPARSSARRSARGEGGTRPGK